MPNAVAVMAGGMAIQALGLATGTVCLTLCKDEELITPSSVQVGHATKAFMALSEQDLVQKGVIELQAEGAENILGLATVLLAVHTRAWKALCQG